MRGGIHLCRVRKQPGTSKEQCTHTRTHSTARQARMGSCKCSDKFRLPSCLNLSCPILVFVVVPSVNHRATFLQKNRISFFLVWKKGKHYKLFMAPCAIKSQNLCNSATHGEANGGLPSKELFGIFFFFFWIMHAALQDRRRLIHTDWDLRLQWTTRPFLSWKINQPDI